MPCRFALAGIKYPRNVRGASRSFLRHVRSLFPASVLLLRNFFAYRAPMHRCLRTKHRLSQAGLLSAPFFPLCPNDRCAAKDNRPSCSSHLHFQDRGSVFFQNYHPTYRIPLTSYNNLPVWNKTEQVIFYLLPHNLSRSEE